MFICLDHIGCVLEGGQCFLRVSVLHLPHTKRVAITLEACKFKAQAGRKEGNQVKVHWGITCSIGADSMKDRWRVDPAWMQ